MGNLSFFAVVGTYILFHRSDIKKLKHCREAGDRDGFLKYMRKTYDAVTQRVCKRFGIDMEISGYENIPDGAVLYVANHQGMFDAAVMTRMKEPCGFVLKKEHSKIPFASAWFDAMNCVFIDRENPRAAVDALNAAAGNLADGYSMIIFPEGTRSRGRELGEFKNGAFKIAQKAKVPVVPVAINGSYKCWEETGKITAGKIQVRILPCINTASLERREYRELETKVRGIISDALDDMDKQAL